MPFIDEWLSTVQIDPAQNFFDRYELSPWQPIEISRRFRRRGHTLVIVRDLSSVEPKRFFFRAERLPSAVKDGMIVFHYQNWISYFDDLEMAPCDHEIEQIRGSKAFAEAEACERSPQQAAKLQKWIAVVCQEMMSHGVIEQQIAHVVEPPRWSYGAKWGGEEDEVALDGDDLDE